MSKDGTKASFYKSLVPFDRQSYSAEDKNPRNGNSSVCRQTKGLGILKKILLSKFDQEEIPNIQVGIPNFTVICTHVFDDFMEMNGLYEIALGDHPDDRIAYEFQMANLPFNILGDLRALVTQITTPLTIRSSSLLEDAKHEPFAGVYTTKMIPNHQFDVDSRFHDLTNAIKLVYASTYFSNAKSYRRATYYSSEDEKMAVIIQDSVGKRHDFRFYPELSGVARSYNFYPVGKAKQEDGVVNLALGLGKTIVDGGVCWTYSPTYPKVGPIFKTINELIQKTQKMFWAVNMGTELLYNPLKETEYMVLENIATADRDGTLSLTSSTYDAQSDRVNLGAHGRGPRILNFAPLLTMREIPVNNVLKRIMALSEKTLKAPVEIEFAMTFNPHRLEMLQVRPMAVSTEVVEVTPEDMEKENVLVACDRVLGNGIEKDISDIVYVIPDNFDKKHTRKMAAEIEAINTTLLDGNRNYMLIVFGRLGSSDPWLGIPVKWEQISGARVIVEATKEGINVEMSQGSHFFHNLTSLGISYFSVPITADHQLDWDWLEALKEVQSSEFIRHVRAEEPLNIIIDGRIGRGVVYKD